MTRRTAKLLWAALLVLPLAFTAVAFVSERGAPAPDVATPLFWLAAVASAVNVTLSRLLPPRLGGEPAGGGDAAAFTRTLVALALCEAAAFAPLVAYLVSRDARLLALLALDLAALAVLFPTDERWAALRVGRDAAAPRRAR